AVPAPGGRAALGTGHTGHITAPWHLHQYGARPQPVPYDFPGERGKACRPRGLVPREVAVPHGPHEGRGGPHPLAVGDERYGPAALDELGGLDGAAPTPQQKGALVP